ncbi:beta-carotene hydroxylase [candidate division KSB1 bacterium]|nr:beta-carotene hydroxylase [candidate division KSB1 bacterium]NIR73438.1 beta-carotene hydroxylase [candidate division KSB1 bacterium]NIS28429.1 beta-carotene hydroxylase [candidate division KSB1 bacterium]NIT75309.1 beta-carotene hydroxylase [candidate division KSB1 bacterium]NIU29157.1 beta-carotene hydroxylase [candidate division KSB1 bacterium]
MNFLILLLSFVAMELVAWLAHKYVMHGILWSLHRDHHLKDHDHVMERNDFFFLIFATPGILLMYFGMKNGGLDPRLWMGLGISLYGLAYVLMHDIFIHQRIKIFTRTDNFYLRGIRRAHKMHHKHLGKDNGECFGMLWAPPKYLLEAKGSARRK